MINVITQSTSERQDETRRLYEACKPYLDKGYGLRKAVTLATGRRVSNTKNGWFRALREYAESEGFDYNNRKWSRGK